MITSTEQALSSLLKQVPPPPVDESTLEHLVRKTLEETPSRSTPDIRKSQWEYALKNEIFALAANEGAALNDPETNYYRQLVVRLDLVLTFTEHDACEPSFPLTTLQDLLETQTITSCSHIFSWIESRAARLTQGMVPQKGKALVLLRTLNDLLRRLSKMGSNTIFCGRILTFLSGVFPLGERSGVNLRGEYGPIWEGVQLKAKDEKKEQTEAASDVDEKAEPDAMQVDELKSDFQKAPSSPSKLADKKSEKKEEFYNTFWSLQLPFSRPPLFSAPETFSEFKEAVIKVMPIIKEASAKERTLMGNRSHGSAGAAPLKRKRDADAGEEATSNDYFFAKFLTSPELLDLEVADTHFRRQFLFQLLILLTHLLTFTKSAKLSWQTPRNRSLQIEFTLEPSDAQWVQETITKTLDELKQTTPGGRAFADSVHIILEREKNWVRWKNEMCTPFDREPYSQEVDGKKVGMEENTRDARMKMRVEPPEWEHVLGSAPLTEIWEMGYRDLSDLQRPFQPGDVKDFVKKVKLEDNRIEMRKKALARQAERIAQARAKATAAAANPVSEAKDAVVPTTPAAVDAARTAALTGDQNLLMHPSLPAKPVTSPNSAGAPGTAPVSSPTPVQAPLPPPVTPAPTPAPAATTAPSAPSVPMPAATPTPAPVQPALPPDEQILKLEENKHRWSWLALRTARDRYLAHFGKIGTGDIILLAQEIEKEDKAEKERIARGLNGDGSGSVAPSTTGAGEERAASVNDADGDAPTGKADEYVKMETT